MAATEQAKHTPYTAAATFAIYGIQIANAVGRIEGSPQHSHIWRDSARRALAEIQAAASFLEAELAEPAAEQEAA